MKAMRPFNLNEGEGLVGEHGGLCDNSGEGKHSKSTVLDLRLLVSLQGGRVLSELQGIEREVSRGTATSLYVRSRLYVRSLVSSLYVRSNSMFVGWEWTNATARNS